jgi:hypothetical protein
MRRDMERKVKEERRKKKRRKEKQTLTIFSPSPIHLDVREEAEIAKKVKLDSVATALAIKVLPFPGGPNYTDQNLK